MKTYMYILSIGGTVIGGDLNEDLYVHTVNRRNSYRRPYNFSSYWQYVHIGLHLGRLL
jgi:hypothetical protein